MGPMVSLIKKLHWLGSLESIIQTFCNRIILTMVFMGDTADMLRIV